MALYAIGDLHLSFGTDKPMDVFGPAWDNHVQRLEAGFSVLRAEDTVVLCGDISWGMSLEQSLEDFRFLAQLPGRKLILKGNHDYWWATLGKIHQFFSTHDITGIEILHNKCFAYGDYALCGTRGWFFEQDPGDGGKVLKRELMRLESSLVAAGERQKLCFLHYPPLYQGYFCPEIVSLLETYRVSACYYGHLHGPAQRLAQEGRRGNVDYCLVAADYLNFMPKKILD